MPQKLNKAGQMQDYIPKGNGDASGEYGTSNGTNKNFTTSEKKSSKANVITENKSVAVGDKEKWRDYTSGKKPSVKGEKKTFDLKDGYTGDFYVVDKLPDGWRVDEGATTAPHGYVWVNNNKSLFGGERETAIMKRDAINNKANIINDDLTGKKEESFEDFYNNTFFTKDGKYYKKSALNGSEKQISQKDYELNKNMANDLDKLGKESSKRRIEKMQKDTMERALNKQFIPFDTIGSDIRDEFKKQVVNDFYKLHKDNNHTYTDEEVKKVVDSYNAWYSGSFSKQEINNLTNALNKAVK